MVVTKKRNSKVESYFYKKAESPIFTLKNLNIYQVHLNLSKLYKNSAILLRFSLKIKTNGSNKIDDLNEIKIFKRI